MSEAAFLFFNRCFSLIAVLLYAVCFVFFLYPFPVSRKRKSCFLFALIFHMAAWLFCEWGKAPRGSFTLIILIVAALGAKLLGLERPMAFLLTLFYSSVRLSSGLMAESFYFLLENQIPFLAEPLEGVYLRSALLISLFLFLHLLVMVVMLWLLRKRVRKMRMRLSWQVLCYMSLIPAASILFGQIVSKLLFEVKDGVLLQLYERHPDFLGAVPLLALLFYVGGYFTVVFQQNMVSLQERQEAGFVAFQQTKAIQERLEETERFYQTFRQMRHESRGHLTNLKALAQSGRLNEIEQYISHIDENIKSFDLVFQTGNAVTDVIVNDKRQQCEERGIELQVNFHYPSSTGYDAFDIGIILQNLLQNALEACEKSEVDNKVITLIGKRKGRFFLIEVKNPFAGKVIFGPGGLPVTTKSEASIHGIGLSNVCWEAKKYMGELEVKTSGQEFSATVLLQERGIV